jgi:hypothetical protein
MSLRASIRHSEASHDLIEDEKGAMFLGELTEAL